MRSPVAPVLAALDELVRGVAGPRDEVWRLEAAGSELKVTAVRVTPGAPVELPGGREVLVIVLDGRGHLRSADGDQQVTAHTAIWLPRDREESLHAGESGLHCLTVLPSPSRPGVRPALDAGLSTASGGGEPACLLQQVCAECGRMATESDARYCNRCGASLAH
ncbi:hypothetical protein [Streptomyces sp. NPDC002952]|uniref:hypothetical protein n=1 Tax=Streptomyces sp. NPDC002952 TaxID=3364673 RepID=UPI0036B17914